MKLLTTRVFATDESRLVEADLAPDQMHNLAADAMKLKLDGKLMVHPGKDERPAPHRAASRQSEGAAREAHRVAEGSGRTDADTES